MVQQPSSTRNPTTTLGASRPATSSGDSDRYWTSYDQHVRGLMTKSAHPLTTASVGVMEAMMANSSSVDDASSETSNSVNGDGKQQLGISFDGESILLPQGGVASQTPHFGQEYSTIGDLNTTLGDESTAAGNLFSGGASETGGGKREQYFDQDVESPEKKGDKQHGSSQLHYYYGGDGSYGDSITYISFCCPRWIVDAPLYLRAFIACSLALFLGAMALTIYAVFVFDETNSEAVGTSAPPQNGGVSSTVAPSPAPVPEDATAARPPLVPLDAAQFDSTVLSFFATAGQFQSPLSSELSHLPTQSLSQTANNNTFRGLPFLVHLGGWNTVDATCPESIYQDVAQQFDGTSVPVLFVMGDEEYNDCTQPSVALQHWRTQLGSYPLLKFPDVERSWQWWTFHSQQQQPNGIVQHPEFFSFVSGHILTVGLHFPDHAGNLVNFFQEWEATFAAQNLQWIQENFDHAKNHIQVMVLLANRFHILSNPTFFSGLWAQLSSTYKDVRVVLVHGAAQDNEPSYLPAFEGMPNFDLIAAQPNVLPPMKIDISVQQDRAVAVSVDQNNWNVP